MVVVPAVAPVTVPEVPTVATAVLLLDHTPPGVASVSSTVLLVQMVAVDGKIGDPPEFTVTVLVAAQPPIV